MTSTMPSRLKSQVQPLARTPVRDHLQQVGNVDDLVAVGITHAPRIVVDPQCAGQASRPPRRSRSPIDHEIIIAVVIEIAAGQQQDVDIGCKILGIGEDEQ